MVSHYPNEKCMLRRLAVAVEPMRITSIVHVYNYKYQNPSSLKVVIFCFKRGYSCVFVEWMDLCYQWHWLFAEN